VCVDVLVLIQRVRYSLKVFLPCHILSYCLRTRNTAYTFCWNVYNRSLLNISSSYCCETKSWRKFARPHFVVLYSAKLKLCTCGL